MLLGISQKHNMCSSPYRLTEICNSQCLSHFAAPFIVARTETFIAENCKLSNKYIKQMRHKLACKKVNDGSGQVCNASCPAQRPLVSARGTRSSIPKQTIQINRLNCVKSCANDPSAGSPTETLLRLLLPLSDKVH